MNKQKHLYPGCNYEYQQPEPEEEPDFIPGTVIPNYDKYKDWPVEDVLRWLNID